MDDHLWSSQLTKCRRVVDCWSVDDHWLCYQTTVFSNFALKTFSDIHFLWKNKACILFVISFLFCLVVTKYGIVMVLSCRMPPPAETGSSLGSERSLALSLLTTWRWQLAFSRLNIECSTLYSQGAQYTMTKLLLFESSSPPSLLATKYSTHPVFISPVRL